MGQILTRMRYFPTRMGPIPTRTNYCAQAPPTRMGPIPTRTKLLRAGSPDPYGSNPDPHDVLPDPDDIHPYL
jgi:hypothetical protein